MGKYILALDQGTTSSRAILFDHSGSIVGVAQKEFTQFFPADGWVEHDANEIWSSQLQVAKDVLLKNKLTSSDIAAIGVTNQRETTVVWEKSTGKPIYNAIVWQDRRTSAFCDELKKKGLVDPIKSKTGLIIDSYFSGTKLKWILDSVPGAREKAALNELCFGTIDSWLVFNLTLGINHVTDVSNASRTMLYNINSLCWDEDLLEELNIPSSLLPSVKSSSEVYGHTTLLGDNPIPIAGIAGDQQAALFGQMCIHPGMVKNTYGTGCFMLMNTGESKINSSNNLITTVAWQIGNKTHYALEGSVFIGGAVVQWLRDGLQIISSSSEIETLASSVVDNGGIVVVPAFSGLGAPHWNQYARGSIFGITRATNNGHIARAALESIAFQTYDVLTAMEADSKIQIKELRVDGGASVNNAMMQFQSDVLNTCVTRPMVTETTALGAAYLAGLAVGFWSDINEIANQWAIDRRFDPSMDTEIRKNVISSWKRAVDATLAWSNHP